MTVFVDNHIVIVKSGYCLELNLIKFTQSKKKKERILILVMLIMVWLAEDLTC